MWKHSDSRLFYCLYTSATALPFLLTLGWDCQWSASNKPHGQPGEWFHVHEENGWPGQRVQRVRDRQALLHVQDNLPAHNCCCFTLPHHWGRSCLQPSCLSSVWTISWPTVRTCAVILHPCSQLPAQLPQISASLLHFVPHLPVPALTEKLNPDKRHFLTAFWGHLGVSAYLLTSLFQHTLGVTPHLPGLCWQLHCLFSKSKHLAWFLLPFLL